jgi:exoribonuclease R
VKGCKIRVSPDATQLTDGFERIRKGMGVPVSFPPEVEKEAARVALRESPAGTQRVDRRDIELLSIDPPGSMDLDQAYAATQLDSGFRVFYAIADVGHFVDPGSALEAESMKRGSTLYTPDRRIPLYPPVLSEGAASLLPEQDRPAVLWTFDVGHGGLVADVSVERALVHSRRRLTYREAQAEIDSPGTCESLQVLKEVGLLRQKVERDRGGVDLKLPDQQVELTPAGFEVVYRSDVPVERWNAQMSLMTGMAAADLMLQRGTGLLRTLPAPSDETVESLRASAAALGLEWPEPMSYQGFIRSLDSTKPKQAAMLSAAKVLFRGAGYAFFDGESPDQPNHYAVAAPYAHVTAPLRRMADRLCNELLLGDGSPPRPLLDRLAEAPEALKAADKRSRELDSRLVDFVEAQMLCDRMGEVFSGVVVQTGAKGAMVQLGSPAVLARSKGSGYSLGDRVSVKLAAADPLEGYVEFEPA